MKQNKYCEICHKQLSKYKLKTLRCHKHINTGRIQDHSHDQEILEKLKQGLLKIY